jgi:hypothetical protein
MNRVLVGLGLSACWVLWGVIPAFAKDAANEQNPDPKKSEVETPEAKKSDVKKKPFEDDLYYRGNRLPHARWRFELTTSTGFHSGTHSRDGDLGLRTNVDYEIPIVEHLTIAPRIIPLFLYHQNHDNDDVWAGGVGVVFRGYSNGKEQRGFFGELGGHVIAQAGKFDGNSGTFNFIDEFGVGYQFKSGWHVTGKVNHISNLGFAEDNASVNHYGLGFGYSLKAKR